jgi:hypothetical protein
LKPSDQGIESALGLVADRHQHQQRMNTVTNAPVEPPVSLRGAASAVDAPVGAPDATDRSPTATAHQANADKAAVVREEPPAVAQGASPLRRSGVAGLAAQLEQARGGRKREGLSHKHRGQQDVARARSEATGLARRSGASKLAEKASQLRTPLRSSRRRDLLSLSPAANRHHHRLCSYQGEEPSTGRSKYSRSRQRPGYCITPGLSYTCARGPKATMMPPSVSEVERFAAAEARQRRRPWECKKIVKRARTSGRSAG